MNQSCAQWFLYETSQSDRSYIYGATQHKSYSGAKDVFEIVNYTENATKTLKITTKNEKKKKKRKSKREKKTHTLIPHKKTVKNTCWYACELLDGWYGCEK